MSKVKFKIIDGGKAIPIGNNLYKLEGRSHEEGGIGIELKDGNAKTIIEAEDGEDFEPKTHEFRIFSNSLKIGNKTPAQLAEAGYNPDIIFKAQQSINGNYGGSYGKDGLIKRLVNFITSDNKKENNETDIKKKPAEGEPINEKEVRLRQAYAESRFDSKAGSHAGARGLFQIMPDLLKDYNKAHGTNYTVDDLYNDEINTNIRDWKMNLNLNSAWATKNAAPDSVVYAKSLGGYNMGNQNFLDTLGVAKNLGVDIYNTLDWVDKKYLPVETVDYINFVLRNQDNSILRNQAAYEASKKLNKDKVDILNNNFKNGGQINMKLKYKNKQDITDMVMNEILPHSTGERKKFDNGGVWGVSEWSLAGNLGLNALNALGQGIIGSITGNKAIKTFKDAKSKLKKIFTPVARERIDTRVNIDNELSGIKQSTAKLIENAQANTSNKKVARLQAQNAIKQQNELEHRAYTEKYREEGNRRDMAAKLATQYNIIDNQNYIQSEREYQDKMLQLDLGIANAEISKGQTWGNAVGSALKAGADSLTDYATMTNDLLKSNNPAAYAEYMKRNYGRFLNPDGTLKDKYKGNTRIENFYNKNLKPYFSSNVLTPTIISYDGGLLT